MTGKGTSFPLRHISIRVPWHDHGWIGTVCRSPKHNSACVKLVNIANNKDEAAEEGQAGQSIKGGRPETFPPCMKERATFMADFAFDRLHEHPYIHKNIAADTQSLQAYLTALSCLGRSRSTLPLDDDARTIRQSQKTDQRTDRKLSP